MACSFKQIYKEKVTDLLSGAQISLRDNAEGDLILTGQTVVEVGSL